MKRWVCTLAAATIGTFASTNFTWADDAPTGVPLPWQTVPAIIQPGTRFVYKVGLAIAPGTDYKTLTGANGPLVDPKTGGKLIVKQQNNQTVGGEGYDVVDIAGATSVDAVAMEMTQFAIGGLQNPRLFMPFQTPGCGVVALKDSMLKGADPASLAAIKEETTGPFRTGYRGEMTIGTKTYKTITIVMQNDQLYSAKVYDLDTGICLHSGTTAQGTSAQLKGDPGAKNGTTTIMLQDLLDIRQIQTPWSASPIPRQLAGLKTMTYQGVSTMNVRLQTPLQLTFTFHDPTDAFLPYTQSVQRHINGPGPQPQPVPDTQDVTAQSLLAPLAIDPAILAKLQKDQTIDTDPDLQYKTSVSYIGPDNRGNNVVVISQISAAAPQQNPRIDSIYDPNTGIMVEQDKSCPMFQTTQTVRLVAKN